MKPQKPTKKQKQKEIAECERKGIPPPRWTDAPEYRQPKQAPK